MSALSSFAKERAEGRRLPYIDISTDFRPLSIPQQHALALRDELAACHERTGNLYRRQRLMECGEPIEDGAAEWKHRCNLSECPLCHRRRAYRKAAEAAYMDKALQEGGFNSQMLTVSVPDAEVDSMAARYAELSEGCSQVYKSKLYTRCIAGAARAIETSMADTGMFHVHLHQLLIFRGAALPEEVLSLVQRCFPQGRLYPSEPLNGVNLSRFAAYVLKLPEGVTAEEWLTIRQVMLGKMPLTFSGLLRRANRASRKNRPAKRKTQ